MSQQSAADYSQEVSEGEVELLVKLDRRNVFVYRIGPNYPLKARLREAITREHLDSTHTTRERVETFGQAFERVYGEALQSKTQGESR